MPRRLHRLRLERCDGSIQVSDGKLHSTEAHTAKHFAANHGKSITGMSPHADAALAAFTSHAKRYDAAARARRAERTGREQSAACDKTFTDAVSLARHRPSWQSFPRQEDSRAHTCEAPAELGRP